jgi:TolB-like protein
MRRPCALTIIFCLIALQSAILKAAAATGDSAAPLTVAILDFQSDAPGAPHLGDQISQTLSATLSAEPGFTLVEREAMVKILTEHSLNLSGLANPDDAIKIGKIVGAKILITGRAFAIDKEVFITAKLIGTETSIVQGVLVRGESNGDMGALILSLSDKIAAKLRDSGNQLIAGNDSLADPLPGLKDQLAKLKLPFVSVRIEEQHIAAVVPVRIDPAAETEVRSMLGECGFTIIDGDEHDQNRALVTTVINGEAFSEYASKIGNLVSCLARVEIEITDRQSGKVIFSDRETARAVDLAENIAGKTALQKAARIVGIHLLQHFVQTLPAK